MNTEPSEQILRGSWLERRYLALSKVRFAMKCRRAADTFSMPGEVAAVCDGAKTPCGAKAATRIDSLQ